MDIEIGDCITLEDGKKYSVLITTIIKEKKYYLVSNVKNISEILVLQIDGENVVVVKDKNEISEVIDIMTNK